MIYLATAVAKLAFTQLDPLYSGVVSRGFMAVLLLPCGAGPEQGEASATVSPRRPQLGLVVLLGCSLVLMNTLFLCGHQQYGYRHCRVYRILGPLSAVITGKSWRERVGIGIAAVGVVL